MMQHICVMRQLPWIFLPLRTTLLLLQLSQHIDSVLTWHKHLAALFYPAVLPGTTQPLSCYCFVYIVPLGIVQKGESCSYATILVAQMLQLDTKITCSSTATFSQSCFDSRRCRTGRGH